jgi:MinD-like ATPase involved in chromosome partitioning or flagellar assembly
MDATEDSGVSRTLGGSTSQGLTDFLADPVKPLQELALQTSQQNLWFLPKGKGSSFPASPEHAEDLLAAAAKRWDFIVVAGGAVLKNSLALGMARHVGRVLLLVTENRTHLEDIDEAQNVLEQCRAQNVSLVFTQLRESVR